MKYLFFLITTTIIIFFIYLGMAYVTMMPSNNDVLEADDAIDVVFTKTIKMKPKTNLKTLPKKASLNVKPEKPNNLSVLKTQQFSDINNEQSKPVKNIDMKDVFPHLPTNLQNDLFPPLDKNNLDSNLLKPLYPYEAYQNNINGWVLLKLFISKTGKVVDVEVLDSSPKGIFENIAVKTAYKKVYPIKEDDLDPKKHTKNLEIKYNAADQNL